MDISLDRVIEAARRRLAALTPEVAGYILLLATRALEPRRLEVSAATVLLTEGGEVHVRPGPTASEHEVEMALRGLLALLLELSGAPAPAITAVAAAPPNAGLSAFTEDLSAALIPINHAAARRALARLYRETYRAEGLAVEMEPSPPSPAAADTPPSLMAAPPPVMAMDRADDLRELDIDVDLEPERVPQPPADWGDPSGVERVEAGVEPVPADAPGPTPPESGLASECRSDVRVLLHRFLPDSRSDERMSQMLLAMIGLDTGVAGTPAEHRSSMQ
jgi:hypothetical protein